MRFWTRSERQRKNKALAVIVATGVTLAFNAFGAGQSEKRIHAIEEKFSLKFVEEIQGRDGGVVWMFVEPTAVRIHVLAIAAPKNATDKEVKAAKTAAEFACGWFEGCLRVEERSPARVLPTPPTI